MADNSINEIVLYDRIETMASFFEKVGTDVKYFLAVVSDDDEKERECFVLRSLIGRTMREKKMYGLDLKEFPMKADDISKFGHGKNSTSVLLYGNADGLSDCIGSCNGRIVSYNPLSACTHEWSEWYYDNMMEKGR